MKLSIKQTDHLNHLYQQAKTQPIYKKIFRGQQLPHKITSYDDWLRLPIINRSNFYANKMDKTTVYVAKSRPDENGNEPILPMDMVDYRNYIHHEEQKLKNVGVKKNDRCSVVQFALSETVLMAQAFVNLGAKYVTLEGSDDIIFRDINQKGINVIFTQSRFLPRIIAYFQQYPQKTHLKLVISTGENANLETTRYQVEKYLHADFIDQIGSRETASYALSCPSGHGYHFLHELSYCEIIDPISHQPADYGELVITPYWREDLPLLRYSTGDVVKRLKKSCTCTIPKNCVFSGIISRVNRDEKIGSTMMPLEKMYDPIAMAFYFQYKYIDSLLWDITKKPRLLMILAKNNYADILIFIMENAKSTLTFRRKKPLQKIISQLEHNSTQSAFIKLSQKKMDNIFPNENYVDIRYLHKNNLPPQLVTILANHRITITTIDEK